jgi:DNA end-binding protein Ku
MHAIWKGSVGFGLVNIPVNLYSGESKDELGFTMLDKRTMDPVGYKKINKKTGEEVPRQDVVKGYELEEGRFVVVEDEDFKRAAPDKSQRVDIQAFVDAKDLDPAYFSAPYYLEPAAKSEKVYALLREALKRSGRAGIATFVLRSKQYLCAVLPRGEALMLVLLRYAHELRDPGELHLPSADAKKLKLSEAELKMAERLIEDLAAPWEPGQYKDDYKDQLMELIQKKAQTGKVEEVELPRAAAKPTPPADIMELLKKSVAGTAKAGAAKAPGRGAGRGRLMH